jgi:putative ABC transport system substrate-binding protein
MRWKTSTCAFFALALSFATYAQSPKVYRIGMLEIESARVNRINIEAFLRGLREAGYVEGKNFVIDYRSADGRPEKFSDLAADLARAGPDIVVTRGTPAALAAKGAIRAPIVMAATADPVATGIVRSFAHPGGNITGLTNLVRDLAAKQMEILRELVPAGSKIGYMSNMSNPANPVVWKQVERGAQIAGLQAVLVDIRDADAVPRALEELLRQRVAALDVPVEGATLGRLADIVRFAAKHKLPAIYSARDGVDAGGLMSYGADYPALYYRVAFYVDKIIKGAKPGDLPIEQPSKFNFVINLKTAKALGIAIPRELLARADEVIQ